MSYCNRLISKPHARQNSSLFGCKSSIARRRCYGYPPSGCNFFARRYYHFAYEEGFGKRSNEGKQVRWGEHSRVLQSFRSDASLQSQAGLTLIELLVAIVLIGIISTTFLIFFKSSLFNYLDLQKDATSFTQLSSQAARVSGVLRGTTGIVTASGNELSVYAYFDPSDTYVSLLHYYVVNNGGAKQLKADLTPMTANPPIGTPITASQRTFVIIDSLYQPSGQNLFAYLNATGGTLSLPITDLQTIKGIRVNLAAQTVAAGGGNQSLAVEVSLRNRKTNL